MSNRRKRAVTPRVAATKAKNTAVLRELKQTAKEVNAFLEKAQTADTRSFDLRLSAACTLAKAREICEKNGIKFKAWCADSVKWSADEVTRLAKVGAADDPKLALEDMRASNAARNRRARAKVKATAGRAPRVTSVAAPAASPYVAALNAATALPDDDQLKIAGEIARGAGMAVVSSEVASPTIAGVKRALSALVPAERRKMLRWLSDKVEEDAAAAGVDAAAAAGVDAAAADLADKPPFLNRTRRKTTKARKK